MVGWFIRGLVGYKNTIATYALLIWYNVYRKKKLFKKCY